MSIKISNMKGTDPSRYAARGAGVRNANENEPLMFRRTLTDMTNEIYVARIQEIKKKIDEQGQRLSDKVDVKEYEKFRGLIREFIDEIVSNGYTFSREDSFASHGRHRYIATVKIVNEKLDELGKEVIKEQADNIEILSRIDDIRGLLLDLMI